eukprot:GFYU01006829.1.p1 GENE.GFYU01006829.1~~GFYU01006829.1.p1  ORF type:complete len:466 (-),score=87.61 GFYU01006829.1:216-1613(-)
MAPSTTTTIPKVSSPTQVLSSVFNRRRSSQIYRLEAGARTPTDNASFKLPPTTPRGASSRRSDGPAADTSVRESRTWQSVLTSVIVFAIGFVCVMEFGYPNPHPLNTQARTLQAAGDAAGGGGDSNDNGAGGHDVECVTRPWVAINYDSWCQRVCNTDERRWFGCPSSICDCHKEAAYICTAVEGTTATNQWCQDTCAERPEACPGIFCSCARVHSEEDRLLENTSTDTANDDDDDVGVGIPPHSILIDGCHVFDGNAQSVLTADEGTITPMVDQYSITVWMKHNTHSRTPTTSTVDNTDTSTVAKTNWVEVFHHGTGADCCAPQNRVPALFLRVPDDSTASAIHYTAADDVRIGDTAVTSSPTDKVASRGEWYMYTLVVNGWMQVMQVYFTDAATGYTELSGTHVYKYGPATIEGEDGVFAIGGTFGKYDRFVGEMCHFRWFPNTALTMDQIATIASVPPPSAN